MRTTATNHHRRAAVIGLVTISLAFGAVATANASTPPTEPERIPDGTYTRVATSADMEAAGVDAELELELLGDDGELPITLEFSGDRWTESQTNDLGIREIGSGGTTTYDEKGRWNSTSGEAWEWSYDDGTLTLAAPAGEGRASDPVTIFIIAGVWQHQEEASDAAAATVTLRFANPAYDAPAQLVAFVEELQRLSDGTIEFEWLMRYGIGPSSGAYSDAEAAIVADLADSTIDIGVIGAHASPGFDALHAPQLVDSHDLQEAVFDAGIPERMLGDLGDSGLVGIAVLPGPLRRVMGVEHPFTSPDDFAGAVVANDRWPLPEATMAALGATSVAGAEGMSLDEIDARVGGYQAIVGNGYETQADSVAANLVMWPRPLVIVMSADSFAALTPEQQDVLLTAGANAVDLAMQASRDEDGENGALLCDAPIDVIEATDAELAEFATALEPVYADLEGDPATADYLDEIRSLKEELGTPPDTLTCPEGDS